MTKFRGITYSDIRNTYKGKILTYEQYLAAKEDVPWMTMGMVRNYGREDAPTWGSREKKSDE